MTREERLFAVVEAQLHAYSALRQLVAEMPLGSAANVALRWLTSINHAVRWYEGTLHGEIVRLHYFQGLSEAEVCRQACIGTETLPLYREDIAKKVAQAAIELNMLRTRPRPRPETIARRCSL